MRSCCSGAKASRLTAPPRRCCAPHGASLARGGRGTDLRSRRRAFSASNSLKKIPGAELSRPHGASPRSSRNPSQRRVCRVSPSFRNRLRARRMTSRSRSKRRENMRPPRNGCWFRTASRPGASPATASARTARRRRWATGFRTDGPSARRLRNRRRSTIAVGGSPFRAPVPATWS